MQTALCLFLLFVLAACGARPETPAERCLGDARADIYVGEQSYERARQNYRDCMARTKHTR